MSWIACGPSAGSDRSRTDRSRPSCSADSKAGMTGSLSDRANGSRGDSLARGLARKRTGQQSLLAQREAGPWRAHTRPGPGKSVTDRCRSHARSVPLQHARQPATLTGAGHRHHRRPAGTGTGRLRPGSARERSMDLFDLSGKTAVVTGGSRGIGLMIARGLLEAGARVYISSRKADACAAAERELTHYGKIVAIPAD